MRGGGLAELLERKSSSSRTVEANGEASPGVETIFAGLGLVEEGLRRSSLVDLGWLGWSSFILETSKLGLKLTHLFFKDVDVLGAGHATGFVVAEAAG